MDRRHSGARNLKIHSYVITTDRGSAPNYDGPKVTLAICKPRIRKRAKVGEIVLAFNGRTLSRERNSVRWCGIVSEVLSFAEYWQDERFKGKQPSASITPDNIYRDDGAGLTQVLNTSHDASHADCDLSGQNVLVFSDVWHLGDSHEPLDDAFGKLCVGGARRHEPSNEVSTEAWRSLRKWLEQRRHPLRKSKTVGRRCSSSRLQSPPPSPICASSRHC